MLAEVPFGEERELEVLDVGTVVRIVTGLAGPAFTYTAAMATAHFGGVLTSLRFRVFQIGALGRGAPGQAIVQA